jgi:ATP-dependent Clp protease ATP-binding subunit ClpA
MSEGLTQAAEETVTLSQEAARHLGSPYTGAEHLILGLLSLDASSAPTSLSALGLSYDGARAAVARFSGIEQKPGSDPPPLSERCLSALDRARELAHGLGRTLADAEDVLGAVLDSETFGVASDRFFWELGMDAEGVKGLRHAGS